MYAAAIIVGNTVLDKKSGVPTTPGGAADAAGKVLSRHVCATDVWRA